MDPAWRIAGNELLFANSFKMKASVILGVAQMTLGIVLRGVNAVYFNEHVDFVCEFVPQILFNLSLFGYMVILIFTKWTIDWDVRMGLATCVTTDGRRELLLFDSSSDDLGGGGGFGWFNSSDDSHTVTAGVTGGGGGGWFGGAQDASLDAYARATQAHAQAAAEPFSSQSSSTQYYALSSSCDPADTTAAKCPLGYGGTGDGCQPPNLISTLMDMALKPGVVSDPMFDGQATLQLELLGLAFICVPWMLLAKPLWLRSRPRGTGSKGAKDDDAPAGGGGGDHGSGGGGGGTGAVAGSTCPR